MQTTTQLPRIAVTTGDPAGIGPEITAKALADPRVQAACSPVIFGPLEVPAEVPPGMVSATGGSIAFTSIKAAVEAAVSGKVDGIVTAPINKESLAAAKIPFIGHTEILASLTGTPEPITMFETHGLRVFFLSRHVSLRRACDLVSADSIYTSLIKADRELKKTLKIQDPLIAVAGLNPHCGEHGLFGDEERLIEEGIRRAKASGIQVAGPIGADSVFHQARLGRYSAVLSLYHDQGHIACKTLDFDRTISLTLGLPFLRTSVDHGTAFDIAGKNQASAVSMIEAILVAARYAPRVFAGR